MSEAHSGQHGNDCVTCNVWRSLFGPAGVSPAPQEPRWRYYKGGNGHLYGWTVEKVEGKYQTLDYKPVGEGSRSNDPQGWCFTRAITHATRKAAKAHALRLAWPTRPDWHDKYPVPAGVKL